jgi:hypothetical protein
MHKLKKVMTRPSLAFSLVFALARTALFKEISVVGTGSTSRPTISSLFRKRRLLAAQSAREFIPHSVSSKDPNLAADSLHKRKRLDRVVELEHINSGVEADVFPDLTHPVEKPLYHRDSLKMRFVSEGFTALLWIFGLHGASRNATDLFGGREWWIR